MIPVKAMVANQLQRGNRKNLCGLFESALSVTNQASRFVTGIERNAYCTRSLAGKYSSSTDGKRVMTRPRGETWFRGETWLRVETWLQRY